MSYPCGYEYLLGQQQPLHNFQLIYPAGYSPLAAPSQSPPTLSNLLHSKQVITQVANTSSPSSTASLSSLTGPAAISGQNKKYRPPHKTEKFTPKPIPPELGNLKTYSNPDILICGNCRELFNDIVDMLEHKKIYCKMRFTCKCDQNQHADEPSKCGQKEPDTSSSTNNKGFQEETSHGKKVHLKCSQCKEVFGQAWDLMFHVQNAHGVNIYKLSDKNNSLPTGK